MSLFDKFQASVGRDVGANRLFVAASGYFNVGDVAGGADGDDILGSTLRLALLSPVTRTSYTLASAIQTTSVIPVKYGLVNFYYPSATTSCKMPSAEVGATLILMFGAVLSTISILPGNASIAIGNSALSCILVSNGVLTSTVAPWIQLTCYTAGEWAVTSLAAATNVTPQRSS